MSSGPHTVLFFLVNSSEPIGKLPRSHFDDPYFPVGGELVILSRAEYITIDIREVVKPTLGVVCVNVRPKD